MKKQCFKCKKIKDIKLFYVHKQMGDGYLGKCKKCAKKDVKNWYKNTIEKRQEYERERFKRPERKKQVLGYQKQRREKYKGKNLARAKINNGYKNGTIKKQPCEVCGNPKTQAHHPDYRKPLDVKWLCFKHHRELHNQKVK